jgi:hypothetical protein
VGLWWWLLVFAEILSSLWWWLLIFADRFNEFVVVAHWVLPIDFMGLWWWLLGCADSFRGFVVVDFCFLPKYHGFVMVAIDFCR